MKFRILILFLLLVCSRQADCQTLYEINYHFQLQEGREDYKAFIYRNDDGTGFMRLEYFDLRTKTRNVVDMQMQETYGADDNGKEDTSLLIFVGLEPQQIIGNVMYKPDNFVFQLSEETGYYEPAFVISIHDDGKEDIGVLDQVRLLQQEDLTKELVLQYFTEQDEFYINLFETTVRGLSDQEKQTQLHLVLVANTDDKTIGKSSVIDKDATLKTFSEIAEFLEIQFSPVVLAGKDFSKVNVDKAISALRPGKQDIVVFYYSGHGFNQDQDGYRFPYLDLRDKSFQKWGGQYTLNVEAIYQKLKAKGARLNLVFSDCCNNDPSQTSNISSEGASTRTSSIGWNMDNCRALFMNPKPMSLLMTAASKGELSAGNAADGGIFTFNFRESLEKFLSPFYSNVSWNTLVENARKQTIARANRTWCFSEDNTKKVCVQNPVFKLE